MFFGEFSFSLELTNFGRKYLKNGFVVMYLIVLFAERYTKMRPQCDEKITSGDISPCSFAVNPESLNARKYNFKVCSQYPEEEKKLAYALDKSLKLEENWCIKVDSCIWDFSIARRLRWRDKNHRIAAYTVKLQSLRADAMIYAKRAVDSATRLKDWTVVQVSKHFINCTEFKAADHLGDWIAHNPKGLSYFCGLTSCNLPCAHLLEFF